MKTIRYGVFLVLLLLPSLLTARTRKTNDGEPQTLGGLGHATGSCRIHKVTMRIDGYNIFQLLECHPRMLKKIFIAEKNFFAPLIVVSKQRERTLLIFIDAKIEKICLEE